MKLFSLLVLSFAINAGEINTTFEIREILGGKIGASVEYGRNQLFLTCSDPCETVRAIETLYIDEMYQYREISKIDVKQLKNISKKINSQIHQEINKDHETALTAATMATVMAGGYVAEETGIYEGTLEDSPVAYNAWVFLWAIPGAVVDLVKLLPQGVIWAGEHIIAPVSGNSLESKLTKAKYKERIVELNYEDYQAVKDGLLQLQIVSN